MTRLLNQNSVDTPLESELVEFCSSYDLIISDYHRYGRDSGQFTYVSDAHNSTSWLDHIICSYDVNSKISSINILNKLPGSDHLPLQMTLDIDFNSVVDFIDNLCPRDKVSFNWSKCTVNELSQYCCLTYDLFTDIHVTPGIKCNNPNCEISSHKTDIDYLYKQICDVLGTASKKYIPSSKIDYYRKHNVPGYNEHVKELHAIARHDFVMWRSAGKPRFGEIYLSMNQSRLRFKSALKYCQQNETIMQANALAESMMNNDMNGFWKDVHKITNSKVPLATKVDGCVGDAKIAEMWKCHYKSLLNSVQSGNSKNSVMLDVNKQIKNSITITPFDILDALKNIKCGKSSGIDGISAEHFIFAHSRIHVLLSLLFSAFITHGYLPGMFMKTAIVPIIKNKSGDTSDKNNYRPIALVTAASKIFELCLSVILENYLFTHDQQFGFKSKHSTDFCIYTVKSVSKYYTQHHSPVYSCFLDASKAFDKINHFKLFRKLLDRKTPIVIVRILLFWYSKQTVCVKWGRCISDYFSISNGVRQGGILSPKLFSVYVDKSF